jgi:hypothetical protein
MSGPAETKHLANMMIKFAHHSPLIFAPQCVGVGIFSAFTKACAPPLGVLERHAGAEVSERLVGDVAG